MSPSVTAFRSWWIVLSRIAYRATDQLRPEVLPGQVALVRDDAVVDDLGVMEPDVGDPQEGVGRVDAR